jgi:uncharacterized protein YbbK (DUF523 family)
MDVVLTRYKLRIPTSENPLRILISGCLTGLACGYDGTSYGDYGWLMRLLKHPKVHFTRFCPEDAVMGTPRALCDIHGGDGQAVLDGKARVLSENGEDYTDLFIQSAHKMYAVALENRVELALLMDISAACGSQVIYDGRRTVENKRYQQGMGVCAAYLQRKQIPLISQRDFASLELLYSLLEPAYTIDTQKTDHHQTEWYLTYFNR